MENDWKNSLSFDDKGNLTKSISNYRAIFTHDENLSQIRFDTFCQDDISFSPLFFNVNGNKVDEESVGKIQDYLEQTYQLRLTQNKVFELLKTTASERSYNPVQEFIRKEMWDACHVLRLPSSTILVQKTLFLSGNRPSCGLWLPWLVPSSLGASSTMYLPCLGHRE